MKDKKRSNQEFQQENDELKSKISGEFGGMCGSETSLPPELENQFLKNVMAFEKQFAGGKEITVYDRIGRPDWLSVENISDGEIGKILQDLHILLNQKGISVDANCQVDDHEMYRFITEELFPEKIEDLSIPGMMTCFIYEEFHPNHEYDAEQAAIEFITRTLVRKNNTDDWYFNENLKMQLSPGKDHEKVIRKIKIFINAWSAIEIHDFTITSIELTEDIQIASMFFDISYDATLEDDSDIVSFEGKGTIKLENVFERLGCVGWDVLECEIPGFKL